MSDVGRFRLRAHCVKVESYNRLGGSNVEEVSLISQSLGLRANPLDGKPVCDRCRSRFTRGDLQPDCSADRPVTVCDRCFCNQTQEEAHDLFYRATAP
eukprot:1153578-Pelagomonas_calceolata.AAC.2